MMVWEEILLAVGNSPAELARRLSARRNEDISGQRVWSWGKGQVPAEFCPDIEALTGIPCERIRPDVAWNVLREKAAAA